MCSVLVVTAAVGIRGETGCVGELWKSLSSGGGVQTLLCRTGAAPSLMLEHTVPPAAWLPMLSPAPWGPALLAAGPGLAGIKWAGSMRRVLRACAVSSLSPSFSSS